MAAPLTSSRTNHKAGLLVSPVFGEFFASDGFWESFEVVSSVVSSVSSTVKVNVVPVSDPSSPAPAAYAAGTFNSSTKQRIRRSPAVRKPLANVFQLNSVCNAASVGYTLSDLCRNDNRLYGVAFCTIFGKGYKLCACRSIGSFCFENCAIA